MAMQFSHCLLRIGRLGIKEEIENKLLPKYRELLQGEFLKKAVLSQQANEEQKQIETHTQNVIDIVKELGQKTVQDLRVMEEKGHREIDQSSTELQRKIHQLQTASQVLSESIDAEPGSFFRSPLIATCWKIFNHSLHYPTTICTIFNQDPRVK